MAVMPKVSREALDYIRSFGIDVDLIPEYSIGPEGYELVVGMGDVPITEFHVWPEGIDFAHLSSIWFERKEGTVQKMEDMTDHESFAATVRDELDAIGKLLVEKNKAYGNSALDPVRVFSHATPEEQILVRIDDKLSRLQRGHEFADEDTVTDLIGYLILLKIARK